MLDLGEVTGLLVLWLAFMSVVGIYIVRIGLMLREQRIVERGYRLRLATLREKSVREIASAAQVENLGRRPLD